MRLVIAAVASLLVATAAPPRGDAWPLDVSAASELRVEPRLGPDRRAVWLDLRLRDDRGGPLADRVVRFAARVDGAPVSVAPARTDAMGEASARVPVTPAARTLDVDANASGGGGVASSTTHIEVALDAPYVSTELLLGASVIERGAPPIEAVVSVDTGRVVALAPGNLPVDIAAVDGERRRPVVGGVTNTSGRAALRLGWERFDRPGVVRLVPRVEVSAGRVREGTPRDVLVRARTVLTLVRVGEADGEPHALELRGSLRMVPDAPVEGAAVRVVSGDETLAGARTDARGGFSVRLPPEVAVRPGLTVQALFEPTEPWWVRSESEVLALTPAPSPPVPWRWMAAPLALALVAVGALAAGRRRRSGPVSEPPRPSPSAPVEGVRAVVADARSLEVVVTVFDAATGAPVEGAEAQVGDGAWTPCGEVIEGLSAGARTVSLRAPGYAPREVDASFPRSGRHALRASMATWREALFEVARPYLPRAPGRDAPPTLREALTAQEGPLAALRDAVEEGAYGPARPDADALSRARALAREASERR